MTQPKTRRLHVRLPEPIYIELNILVLQTSKSASHHVHEALKGYLGKRAAIGIRPASHRP